MMTVKSKPCPVCRRVLELEVTQDQYDRYIAVSRRDRTRSLRSMRSLIQKAFPHLTASQRESLITGYCNPCWNDSFGDDEDEEGE